MTMIHILAILGLLGAPAFGLMPKGLTVRYDMTASAIGVTSFMEMPQTRDEAIAEGWVNMTRPKGPTGYETLDLWCPKDNYTVCFLYDDTSNVAGTQIALNSSRITGTVFDWVVSGFTNWTINVDGWPTVLYATQMYFVSAEDLALSAAVRLAQRNDSVIIQKEIIMTGFYGKLFTVSTNVSELEDRNFTKQGCYAGMGTHYVYNMTPSFECSAETVLPFALMTSGDQIISVTFLLPGLYPVQDSERDWFERPARTALEVLVPNGAECFYNYSDTPGWLSSHIYFIDIAYEITC